MRVRIVTGSSSVSLEDKLNEAIKEIEGTKLGISHSEGRNITKFSEVVDIKYNENSSPGVSLRYTAFIHHTN